MIKLHRTIYMYACKHTCAYETDEIWINSAYDNLLILMVYESYAKMSLLEAR